MNHALVDASYVAGVDRWRKGWVVALYSPTSGSSSLRLDHVSTIDAALELTSAVDVVAIDMPMALPTSGRRPAEVELKAALGTAGRSIFYSPTVDALGCADRASADAVNRAAGAGGISAQSWGLAGSIREVRSALTNHSAQQRWWETHPESAFAQMSGDVALASKRSATGAAERLKLLTPVSNDVLAVIERDQPLSPLDDVLDAIAAAWSAARIASGEAIAYGPQGRDDSGFPTHILI